MGLMSYFSGRTTRKAVTATPAALEMFAARQVTPYPALGGTNLTRDRINGAHVKVQNASYGWIYSRNPSARRVIDYIAGNVAQLGLKLYERVDDDDRQQVGDHPAAEALRRPNPFTPGKKFIRGFVTDFLTYDNAYGLKFRQNGPLSIVQLPPCTVGIVGQSRFAVDAYRIWRADGTYFDVRPEDMIHWRGENPEDPRCGESKLETLREELAADAAARQANTELHKSGLALPGWIERPLDAPEWDQDDADRFVEKVNAMAKKSRRSIPVFEEGMKYQTGGVTPEDAELLAARRFTMEYVASLYGMKNVPPADAEERKQFYTDVIPDITSQLADFLGLQVLEAEYGLDDHYFEFNLDEKLMGEDRLKAITSAVGAPPLLRNEGRAMLNKPAIEGGDEPITPLNVLVGDNPKPSPGVMPIQNPNGPEQDGSGRSDDEPLKSLNGNGKVDAKGLLLIPRRVAQKRRRDEYAAEFESTLKAFTTRVEKVVKSGKVDTKAIGDRWEPELAEDLLPVARRAVAREGGNAAARMGLADIDMDRVEGYIRRVTGEKSKQIVSALRKALIEGEPAEVFKAARESEGPRAAQTLATTFAAFAVREAAQQSPDAERRMKTWIVTSGNSEHPELDGETVPLGASFSNGADGPPADHPGCMCSLECS